MSGGSGGGKAAKASSNLQARIKKMMQSDEDVGKVAKASPVLIGVCRIQEHWTAAINACPHPRRI